MPSWGVRPAAHEPRAAQGGCQWGPAQRREFTYKEMRFFVCDYVAMHVTRWPDAQRPDTPAATLGSPCRPHFTRKEAGWGGEGCPSWGRAGVSLEVSGTGNPLPFHTSLYVYSR